MILMHSSTRRRALTRHGGVLALIIEEYIMSNVVYMKLSENRGKKRIWMEGQRLANQGISPGMRFIITKEQGKVVLAFCEDGDRIVSRRMRNERELPVIDVEQNDLGNIFGKAERLRVVIRHDKIIVTIHHQEQAEAERLKRIITKLRNNVPLDMGSLASGAGVLDHALHTGLNLAGVPSRLSFAVEIEKTYLDASQENNPIWDSNSIGIEAPMQEVEVNKLPKVEILNAGLPCTGASIAGKSKLKLSCAEEHETAGALFVAFLRICMATQPAIVCLENVPLYSSSASMTVIRSVLSELGYDVHETILDGNEMGALEARKRMCMVALTKGLDGFDLSTIKPVRQKENNIAEILEIIDDNSTRWKSLDYLKEKEARDIKAGKGFRRQVLSGSETSCGTIGRSYQKYRSTEPVLRHPTTGLDRLFTPVEHSRLKNIPEILIAGVPDTTAHEILGQSIIHCAFVAVGKHIGESICRSATQQLIAA